MHINYHKYHYQSLDKHNYLYIHLYIRHFMNNLKKHQDYNYLHIRFWLLCNYMYMDMFHYKQSHNVQFHFQYGINKYYHKHYQIKIQDKHILLNIHSHKYILKNNQQLIQYYSFIHNMVLFLELNMNNFLNIQIHIIYYCFH